MIRRFFTLITIIVSLLTVFCIIFLVIYPPSKWLTGKTGETPEARIIIPRVINSEAGAGENQAERVAREEQLAVKVPLENGEIMAAVLNDDWDEDQQEEQLVAYRNLLEIDGPIFLTYIGYDSKIRGFRRLWSAPTAASRPGTISLYSQDLVGDRSVCALLSGMNSLGEHTLTIFRKTPENERAGREADIPLWTKIAELRIDGSISVRETERTQAYQLGIARGASFSISAYGRDYDSANIMDQIEITYVYNPVNGLYEQSRITRVPGNQIEQRRVQELLGNSRVFEEFITGLWYYVTPQGTIDSRQYIYFDPLSREIIFYADETQQIFTWQASSATRYGIYINSQNISVTTLRRFIDIELESLDSLRVKVVEDVRLRFGVSTPWDGSYRKASPQENQNASREQKDTYIDALYDSSIGKTRFFPDGNYELASGGTIRSGKYIFFQIGGREILELRSTDQRPAEQRSPEGFSAMSGANGAPEAQGADTRETYLVQYPAGENFPGKTMTLLRVRIGARGVQETHEGSITLTLSE
jgi:hypothetical protein